MSHELSKLTMIDSDAQVHVCSLNSGQGDGFRKSSETRPLPGAEMQQRGMRQVSYDTDVGRVTAVYRVLDMRQTNLVAGVHEGLGLRCVLHEGPMLDCTKKKTVKNLT